MTLQHIDIVFQLIAFLFAISVHESAHAWMANLRGDPTARMLGRISLNPIKHIDPVGTLLLPAVAMFFHAPVIGWAKPTPVDPRNFKNPVLDDILTSVVGPISNFVVATGAVFVLALVKLVSPLGRPDRVAGLCHRYRFISGAIVPAALRSDGNQRRARRFQSHPGSAAGWQPRGASSSARRSASRSTTRSACLACSFWCFGVAACWA